MKYAVNAVRLDTRDLQNIFQIYTRFALCVLLWLNTDQLILLVCLTYQILHILFLSIHHSSYDIT